MLLTRKSDRISAAGPRLRRLAGIPLPAMDRRTFLKRSGLVAGAGAFASQLPYGAIGKADAAADAAEPELCVGIRMLASKKPRDFGLVIPWQTSHVRAPGSSL